MMTNKVWMGPTGDVLDSYANARLSWATALGELIDNAFDAGAMTFAAEFTKDSLIVRDDGHGCPDPSLMIRLGARGKSQATRLGRYGIGGKDAALWIGGLDSTIRIRTVHADILRTLTVNWRQLGKDDFFADPPTTDMESGGESLTEILITPAKRPPHGEQWRDLLVTLGYLFSAALKQGRQIKFRRPYGKGEWEPLTRWELPKFDGEIVDTRVTVNGRGARVYCGVVKAGELNPRAGFTYSHEWRVIEQASANGCGQFSVARVCGFVDLDAAWPLTKNKDGVSRDADALYLEVERVARPILERAHRIGSELRSRQFEMLANDLLNNILAAQRVKAKRGKGTGTGTKTPTGTGNSHGQAEQEQPGDRFGSRQTGKVLLDYKPFGHPDDLGEVKPPSQVLLNSDNPFVADLRTRREALAIASLALSLLSAEHCNSDKPLFRNLPMPSGFSTKDFSKAMGSVLSMPITMDGKTIRSVPA